MVTQVTAFADASGRIHATELEALEADAIETLKNLNTFNHASAQAIARDAIEVVKVLGPLAEAQARKS